MSALRFVAESPAFWTASDGVTTWTIRRTWSQRFADYTFKAGRLNADAIAAVRNPDATPTDIVRAARGTAALGEFGTLGRAVRACEADVARIVAEDPRA